MNVSKTKWARYFKKDNPISYGTALQLAHNPDLRVVIDKNNETGKWMYSISVVDPDEHCGFWMDSFETKKEALSLCKEMGWKVIR